VRVAAFKRRNYKEALKHLEKYPWSSLDGYLHGLKKKHWLNYDQVLAYVGGSRKKYAQFIEEGLQAGYPTPWEDLKGQMVLGEEGFWERVREKWERKGSNAKEQPSVRWLERVEPKELLKQAATYFNVKVEELAKRRSRYRDQRALVMELMHRHSRAKQTEIGEHLERLDYTLVSRERKRVRGKMEIDPKVRKWYREIEQRLSLKFKI
jgi:cell division protein ZapA (FtsZ GTPase activity inhibitor)